MYLFHLLFRWLFDARASMMSVEIAFLKEQNRILREHLPQKRLTFTKRQKERLLRFDKLLGCKAKEILTIVHRTTWYRWKQARHKVSRSKLKRGRPRSITEETKDLIGAMVKDNPLWGYTKIMAELKKLNIAISLTSIRNILKEKGFQTFPRRSTDDWDKKLKRTFHTLWACDFFTKTAWTPLGRRYYFVLFFINVRSREVHLAGISKKPDAKWILRQLQQLHTRFNPHDKRTVLIRDRDGKFSRSFDEFFEERNVTVLKTPFRSPNLNPYAESWVATAKRECLDHFFVLGKIHLEYILKEFVEYYNIYRPHSGMEDQPLTRYQKEKEGEIYVKPILGGLHHHYYRKRNRK